MAKFTTEELDKAQFGRVIHMRPEWSPPHLSEYLLEEMIVRNWSRGDVYERLGYDADDCDSFDRLMDEKDKSRILTERDDKALQFVFGIEDAGFFIRLYDAWRLHG